MRGKLGPILSGVGGFLLVFGILLNVYAYPRLATAPLDQDSVSYLEATDATVFDIGSLSEIQTDLATTAQTIGDVEAAESYGNGVRVWENSTSTKSSDGVVRSRSIERIAFDGYTGEAVDCCDAYAETTQGQPEAVKFDGLVFKFPFLTEKKTYQWWDGTLKKALPAEFVREEEFEGMKTYVFVQEIEPTVWSQMDVPGSVVGEEGDSVTADRTYSNTRTFWVEPQTGVVINRTEEQGATLRVDGEDRATLTKASVAFAEETVQQNLDDYKNKPALLQAVRVTLPIVFGVAGLVLLVVGLIISRRREDAEA